MKKKETPLKPTDTLHFYQKDTDVYVPSSLKNVFKTANIKRHIDGKPNFLLFVWRMTPR